MLHAKLFKELDAMGHKVVPGDLGENVLTRGADLRGLATGARLRLGSTACEEVTGLCNSCPQIEPG